jgi:hypothetical protein
MSGLNPTEEFLRIFLQVLALQDREQALDGRDDDAGVFFDVPALQMLGDVEVGEMAAVAGRAVLLELVERLFAKIVAVNEEEDAFRARMLDKPIREGAGGEGLAGAHGHLDQGTLPGRGQRALQAVDSIDLAVAQAAFI